MRILLALLLLAGCLRAAEAQTDALKAGDVIAVSVFQDPKLDRQLLIGPSGMISFPLVGQIKAAGMTLGELETLLKSKLRDKYTTDLDITVALISAAKDNDKDKAKDKDKEDDEAKPRFFVTGEVRTPGAFRLRSRLNVAQGLALAGGLSQFASPRHIQIHRKLNGAESIFIFNYADFQTGRNLNDNIDLREGDVIIVPERGLFE